MPDLKEAELIVYKKGTVTRPGKEAHVNDKRAYNCEVIASALALINAYPGPKIGGTLAQRIASKKSTKRKTEDMGECADVLEQSQNRYLK